LNTLPVKIWLHLETCIRNKNRKDRWTCRRLDWKVRIENNNSNQKLIKEQWIYNWVEVVIEELEVNIVENIERGQIADRRETGVKERKCIYAKR